MTDDEITKALNDIRFYWNLLEERNKELEAALRYYAKGYENPFGDDDSLVARIALGEKSND